MDAENASLGDERRARREEYGHGQRDTESRGFASFGSHEYEGAEGSHGATNRPDPVPDRGYTWTPAPPSATPQNQQNTGSSAALDPFAAWSTSDAPGDSVGIQTVSPADHEPDSRFTTAPHEDGPPYIPDDPHGFETAALPTRSKGRTEAHSVPGQADSAAMPDISPPGLPSRSLSPSSSVPPPGSPMDPSSPAEPTGLATETTVSEGRSPNGLPQRAGTLSAASATQLPITEPAEADNSGFALSAPEDPGSYRAPSADIDALRPAGDTGSLPSWLSSIGEEAVPRPLETGGGRRRRLDPDEPVESAEQFNPFEDQHRSEPADGSAADAAEPFELPNLSDGPGAEPEDLSSALPTRTSHTHSAAVPGEEDDSTAPPPLARRLPRSAARHTPAAEQDAGTHETHSTDAAATPGSAVLSGPDTAGNEETPALSAPRRLPRSASRFTSTGDNTADSASREADADAAPISTPGNSITVRTDITAGDGSESDGQPADLEVPLRRTPPSDSVPILDRLLDPESAHSSDPGAEPSAPVSEILTRIMESEQESPADSRIAESRDIPGEDSPDPAPEAIGLPRRSAGSPLTLVSDEESAPTSDTDTEGRPPLETRRSRRAREAAHASDFPLSEGSASESALSSPQELVPALPVIAPSDTEPGAAPPAPQLASAPPDTGVGSAPAEPPSRHSRSEEGADIDIHLIMRLLTASDDLEILAGRAETGEVSTAEVARAAREARSAVLSAVSAWYGGPTQMVKFANALLQAARES